MNRHSKRVIKKKAVPLCFRRSQSSSQFLATAQYKHRIKKLKKVNKELACSLQDAKCRAADQERALSECNRESTQMMFVKMKVKDIVETVQKLVTDLGEVYDVIDGKSFDFLKNCSTSHQEARIRIRTPSISTIEESASMSTIEPDLSKEESPCIESASEPARIKLPPSTPPLFDADSSRTEIYNVPLVLASEKKLRDASNENRGAVTRSSKSLERTNVVTRSSKSLERTGSLPLDQASPSTPQTPVFLLNFPSCIKPQSLEVISKLKPIASKASIESLGSADPSNLQLITSQASIESQRSADPPKLQLITSSPAIKLTPKVTVSKIPVKKLASSENNSAHSAIPSNHMNRRKTFIVEENIEEPHISLPISDRRGTFVLDALAGNAKSDIISDQRGTIVLNSMAGNAKSDIISDRRGTFVLNSMADNGEPGPIFDRRTTYFIPTQSEEQPDSSPPKAIETSIPVQNAAPNQTILLCEDMELTEIIPHQNQPRQFIPAVSTWVEKLETKDPGLSEKLPASARNQFPCPTSLVKQLPVTNINSSKQFEVSTTHADVMGAQIQNAESAKKKGGKSSASNVLSETKMASVSSQDGDSAVSQKPKNKEKDVKKNLNKAERNANIKCPAKELPSPISHFAKTDLSIQHKIFESISAINTVPEKNKQNLDNLFVAEGNDRKKSTILKDSLSNNQPAADKLPEQEDAGSPKRNRRSRRKQSPHFNKYFSDSDGSDIDFDEDFIPEKRFSLKPGRKIINPNNKKVFVFKKNSAKQSSDKDIPTDSCSDKSLESWDIKNDLEKDVFNFSASSEADKSPLKKQKKRKSVVPKGNKRSVNRKSNVDDKILSKRKSKRNSKPEVNQTEVPVAALPRKSILCLNKDNSSVLLTQALQSNRKSVRFTLVGNAPQSQINYPSCGSPLQSNIKSVRFPLEGEAPQGEINYPNCASPSELNATPVNQKSNDVHDTVKESSRDSQDKRLSDRKKNSSTRSNSLKATEDDALKRASAKLKKNRKRQSCDLNMDSPEDDCKSECSPKKKMSQASNETPKKIKKYTNSSCEKQEAMKDVKDRFEHSQGMPATVSSEVPEEKPADTKKENKSGEILSELPLNLNANVKVTGSADKIKGRRPFSGVSERRSSKKESLVDDLFLDLDNAVFQIENKKTKASFKLVEDEPIKEMTKSVETVCNKGSSRKTKTPKQKNDRVKKESFKKRKTGSEQSKDKENTPNIAENLKVDILTSDNNLCTLLGSKDSIKNLVKPKRSRTKKESATLLQKDLKTDILSSENPIGSGDAFSGRSRRNKPVISFKEPSLHTKMRRE